jgi:hypothetical protein
MSYKQRRTVQGLVEARIHFAGIGTRKANLELNKLAKTDLYAYALRVALEIEDVNLTAKRYFGGDCGGYTYAELNYLKKSENIETLIGIAKSQGWVFGVQATGAVMRAQETGPSGLEACSRCDSTGTCNYGRGLYDLEEPEPGSEPDYHQCDKCNGSGKSKHAIQRREQQTHVIYFNIPGVGQVSWQYSPREPLPDYPGQWDSLVDSRLPKLEVAVRRVLAATQAARRVPCGWLAPGRPGWSAPSNATQIGKGIIMAPILVVPTPGTTREEDHKQRDETAKALAQAGLTCVVRLHAKLDDHEMRMAIKRYSGMDVSFVIAEYDSTPGQRKQFIERWMPAGGKKIQQ